MPARMNERAAPARSLSPEVAGAGAADAKQDHGRQNHDADPEPERCSCNSRTTPLTLALSPRARGERETGPSRLRMHPMVRPTSLRRISPSPRVSGERAGVRGRGHCIVPAELFLCKTCYPVRNGSRGRYCRIEPKCWRQAKPKTGVFTRKNEYFDSGDFQQETCFLRNEPK